jgi:hypothetical protein
VAFCDCRALVLSEECFGFVLGRLACEATTKSERHRDRKGAEEEENEKEKVVKDGAGADGKADCRVQGGFQSL